MKCNAMVQGVRIKEKEKKTYFFSTITNIYHSKQFFFGLLASSICSVSNYCQKKRRFISFFQYYVLVGSFTPMPLGLCEAQRTTDQTHILFSILYGHTTKTTQLSYSFIQWFIVVMYFFLFSPIFAMYTFQVFKY